jgi:hypothetical protein
MSCRSLIRGLVRHNKLQVFIGSHKMTNSEFKQQSAINWIWVEKTTPAKTGGAYQFREARIFGTGCLFVRLQLADKL